MARKLEPATDSSVRAGLVLLGPLPALCCLRGGLTHARLAVLAEACAVVYTALGTGACRVLRARPAATRTVTRASGTAMGVIGGALLFEQVLHRSTA